MDHRMDHTPFVSGSPRTTVTGHWLAALAVAVDMDAITQPV